MTNKIILHVTTTAVLLCTDMNPTSIKTLILTSIKTLNLTSIKNPDTFSPRSFVFCFCVVCLDCFFQTYVARARDHLLTDQGAILSESVGSDTEKTWNEPERIWTDSDEDLNSIRGVWVISDDPEVFEQVRRLAPLYFPGVEASRGVVNGWSSKWKGAHVVKQVRWMSSRRRRCRLELKWLVFLLKIV